MVTDLALALVAILAGSVGMLLILLLWFGDSHARPVIPFVDDPIMGPRDQAAIHESQGSFIPMPAHLRSHDEMVAWMTKELPKLTAKTLPQPNDRPQA
ncbi:hypothetical protein [Microvirga pudoricolor]|uniref:hypothetical protein n=1 Tax=Microvirga pudoricolor TaxID=2778729 RepID=UPI00194E88CB|nr:hypothetical protein [Microvirga pudoricolor]MBM6595730.1 hypothetical protein [Microvirga pudoricolor]